VIDQDAQTLKDLDRWATYLVAVPVTKLMGRRPKGTFLPEAKTGEQDSVSLALADFDQLPLLRKWRNIRAPRSNFRCMCERQLS
jgi:hypothetical protein